MQESSTSLVISVQMLRFSSPQRAKVAEFFYRKL